MQEALTKARLLIFHGPNGGGHNEALRVIDAEAKGAKDERARIATRLRKMADVCAEVISDPYATRFERRRAASQVLAKASDEIASGAAPGVVWTAGDDARVKALLDRVAAPDHVAKAREEERAECEQTLLGIADNHIKHGDHVAGDAVYAAAEAIAARKGD